MLSKRCYLVYFEHDNTWDILPKAFIKNEKGESCNVYYVVSRVFKKPVAFVGLIEYRGSEEECKKRAMLVHPHCFQAKAARMKTHLF